MADDLPHEVICHALTFASSWRDVVACAGVSKNWRKATKDAARYDLLNKNQATTAHDEADAAGGEGKENDAEECGCVVETFEGFEWSDWETLREAEEEGKSSQGANTPLRRVLSDLSVSQHSPKTPSPERTILVAKTRETLIGKVVPQLKVVGHLLTSIRVNSFSLDDAKMQSILVACPNLRGLAVSHVCARRIARSTRALSILDSRPGLDDFASPVKTAARLSEASRERHVRDTECLEACGCAALTGAGLENLGTHVKFLERLDLELHHVFHPSELGRILHSVGQKMDTMKSLSIKLIEPGGLKHQSLRKHYEWIDRAFFTRDHLEVLTRASNYRCSSLRRLRFEPWTGATDENLRFCAQAFSNLKSLVVANPAHSQIDGTISGGIDKCASLAIFAGLETLRLSQVRDFQEILQVLATPDAALTKNLKCLAVDCHCGPEEWQVNEFGRSCAGIASVHLSYFDTTRENYRRDAAWRNGSRLV